MSKKPVSREYRVYLAIWRKAYLERDSNLPPITINASTYAMAISMRQGMYRAIKPYRDGSEFDPELSQATELFVAYIPKEPQPNGTYQVILRPRTSLNELEAQLDALGLAETDLKLSEERLAEDKLSAFIETPVSEVERPANPFYGRD